ncbi:MAG TPA: TetR family transcriptional regulator C-terminal domain-containing protein, partial [Candidatus Saccharimonadales bacterium]|nr:TetR family transcriptional regulator C-terminal domain-containing protein [Candidatus Saccharimonadales bacterium]
GYVRGLRSARAKGQIRADLDPETVAYCLMAMAEGLGMRWVLWEDKLPPPTSRKTLDQLLRATLLPR